LLYYIDILNYLLFTNKILKPKEMDAKALKIMESLNYKYPITDDSDGLAIFLNHLRKRIAAFEHNEAFKSGFDEYIK